ncbi:MAG: Crp/Fnr family transcriptional regulator [Lawsonibacter sp.]|nr:Crp/Fnr family transcriptional regulator [Lawsonibacter sp.]
MRKQFELIRTSPMFAGIAEEEAEAMLGCLGARTASAQKETYLLRRGERTEAIGLVLLGSVLIVQEDVWGRRNLLARIMPGQIFAESFACKSGAVLNVSAVAAEPCKLMWLDVQRVLTTCSNGCAYHDRLIRNLISEIAGKNLRFSEKLTHMGKRTTREKLLSYLSAEAQRCGSSELAIPFTRQQLADYLSVERSAMSAELSKLRDDGYLTFEKNHFVLHITEEG